MSQKHKFFFIALILLEGCAFSIRNEEVKWRFPVSSKDGCPDLVGRYYTYEDGKYPTGDRLFVFLTGGFKGVRGPLGIAVDKLDQSASPPYNWTVIRKIDHFLDVSLVDRNGRVFSSNYVDLSSPRVGCYDGMLIVHRLENVPRAESAAGQVQYYELVFQKLSDGSLQARRWYASQSRSNLTGKASGFAQTSFDIHKYPLAHE